MLGLNQWRLPAHNTRTKPHQGQTYEVSPTFLSHYSASFLWLITQRNVLSDISLQVSWQPVHSKPHHYHLNMAESHKGKRTSECVYCALFLHETSLKTPGQVKAGTNTPWPQRPNGWRGGRLLWIKPSRLDLWGQEEEGSEVAARHLTSTCMPDCPPGKEGRGQSSLMASYSQLQSCWGQWAIRSKCWWLGRHSEQTWPPVNLLNLHNNISLQQPS